ncbi:MAG: hypothetical protein IKT14_03395 [Clostridiales bacterium]|nr:hypothetical protein [Clostridiales bacterium]
MLIGLIIAIWIADIVFQYFRYTKDSQKCNYLGMICAMISSGIIVYLISLGNRPDTSSYIVNGAKVSAESHNYMSIFVIWLLAGAALNLIAMGIGYMISSAVQKKK